MEIYNYILSKELSKMSKRIVGYVVEAYGHEGKRFMEFFAKNSGYAFPASEQAAIMKGASGVFDY